MGTVIEITVAHRSEERARQAIEMGFREIEEVEKAASAHLPSSAISRINREGDSAPVPLHQEMISLFLLAKEISEATSGAFDISIGPVVRLWDIENGGRVPSSEELANSLEKVGFKSVVIDQVSSSVGFSSQGMSVDLGGIAKGWAVDRAAEKIAGMGIRSAIVDAGGDLRLIGSRPGKDRWRIGIQHPRSPGKLLVSLDLADTAIVTSGDYERFFMVGDSRYHHILDPATGMPAQGCQSVTVIAETAAEADACATAAFVLGPDKGIAFLRSRPGVGGLIVDAGGALHWTDEALAAKAHQ